MSFSRLSFVRFCFALLVLSQLEPASAADRAEISAPTEIVVGSAIEVTWTGPAGSGDFLSVDAAGAAEADYGPYVYTRKGSPVEMRAPDEPGDYEIRYHLGEAGYPVIGKASLKVIDTRATLTAPGRSEAGSDLRITWTGPNGKGDFISVDAAGAPDREYGRYVYTKAGKALTLRAPDEPGNYEIRYHLGQTYRVIGKAPLIVGDVEASLTVPAQAKAGAELSVEWSGPDGQGDYISVDAVGAPDREYGPYVYTKAGNPLTLRAPDEPGEYVIRYHLGQSYRVIASAPLRVGATTATVSPPKEIEAGQIFEVAWTGPDQTGDFVTIVPVGTPEREYGDYAYTRRGSPVRVRAPSAPGAYEVRYATGQKYLTLAAVEVTVIPGTAPGKLRVLADADEVSGTSAGAVELILDASGSMLQKLAGERRIDLAKAALTELTRDVLPTGAPFALRVFGHREAGSCRTDLEIPLGPLQVEEALTRIRGIEAKNRAKTPIAASLAKVSQDLAGTEAPRVVILVTDGEETCDGDPKAVLQKLRAEGFLVRVNIVGFAIDELMLKEEFESWAQLGQGRYFDASDGDELRRAVRQSLRLPYQVLRGDEIVASGVVNGDAVELAPGSYQVRLLTRPPRSAGEVVIQAGGEAELKTEL